MRRGTRLKIEPTAGILLVALLLTDRTHLAAAALLAATVHEAGHLAAARVMRIPVRSLHFHLLGAGLTTGGRLLTYGEEAALCATGPLASLFFSAALAPLWRRADFAVLLSCASLTLGLLNLMPVRAFDGGRLLEAALAAHLSPATAERILTVTSLLSLWVLWASAVYLLLRAGDGLSLWCFSMSLFSRFFTALKRKDFKG